MKYFEFLINRINTGDVPTLNKEQFIHILKIISKEGEINMLDQMKNQIEISPYRYDKTKEFNKLSKRRKPEVMFKNIKFEK